MFIVLLKTEFCLKENGLIFDKCRIIMDTVSNILCVYKDRSSLYWYLLLFN